MGLSARPGNLAFLITAFLSFNRVVGESMTLPADAGYRRYGSRAHCWKWVQRRVM
jgi:hypothetical protein